MSSTATISAENLSDFQDKRGHKPRERRCLAIGETRDPLDMVRFVLSPDGVVTPDIARKLPGRGVWVSADRKSLEKTIALKSFSRGFKTKAELDGDLVSLTESLLARRVLGLITICLLYTSPSPRDRG